MGAELIAWAFTTGWASGINAYAVVFVLGLIERFAHLGAVPDVVGRLDVLVVAFALFLAEAFADKIPYIDSAWDAVHLSIRPIAGATVGYLIGHESSSLDAALLAATGGVSALASALTKSTIRAGVNASPEPVSNMVVSTAEDAAVIGVVSLAAASPLLAAGVAGALLLATAVAAFLLLRSLRQLKDRFRIHTRPGL